MKHGLISVAGWTALACWAVSLVSIAIQSSANPDQEANPWVGLLALAAIVLTVGWAYGRWWWWKEKTRARAWREGLNQDKRD